MIIENTNKSLINIALLGMLLMVSPFLGEMAISHPTLDSHSQCDLVILADLDDPYYPLAEEIAAYENAPITHSLAEALSCQPIFMLWVVSPDSLSDQVMIEFGLTMKEQPSAVSSGIITASTLEQARELWRRRTQVQEQDFFAVNAINPAAHINEGRILNFKNDQATQQLLTKSKFLSILQSADYLTFTGHGSNKYFQLDYDTLVTSNEIASLDSLVISTGSCRTFRLWNDDSIALRFADQGAAAYSGFVFSPIQGYLLGEGGELPFRYTWSAFPIGHVIQAQNHGTLQGFANLPYQHILGDPRIAFQDAPPYQLVEDRQENDQRVMVFQDVPAGVIPIHVEDGAIYHFIQALGITSAAEQDPFYNSRLQMVNIQEDKFILLIHEGGDLTLRLSPQAPWYWFIGDLLSDSFDHTLVFIQQLDGDIITLMFAFVPLLWVGWQMLIMRLCWNKIRLAILLGIGATVLHGAYVLIRNNHVTITSNTVVFSPLSMLAIFIVTTCGAIIYFYSQAWFGKVMGLIVATIVYWSRIAFGLRIIAKINRMDFIPGTDAALYKNSLGLLPVSAFLLVIFLYGLVFRYTDSMERKASQRNART
jgi:hypothetical protein